MVEEGSLDVETALDVTGLEDAGSEEEGRLLEAQLAKKTSNNRGK
jgi:hypothetical protein